MKPIRVHLTGAAHIDPVWLWRWQEGYAEIKATFRSALDRLAQFDDFIFTSGCAAYYEWVEQNCPEMFSEIRERVAEGRWVIVGGQWIQPDCNIPSGESFARHSLYSQTYFRSRFGRTAEVGYNVDSFGHNGNLPQLLRLSGMRGYIYMRPNGDNEHSYDFPGGVPFDWVGVDGTSIPAYRLLNSYSENLNEESVERLRKAAREQEAAGISSPGFSVNYGVGNHGGGPTVRVIQRIHELQKSGDGFEFIFSSPARYFAEVEQARASGTSLPVVHGDLQHHASGCYSTHSESKAANRRCEERLVAAEKCAVLSSKLVGGPLKADAFASAWKKLLFNQFHDIMGGCSIRSAFDDVRESHGAALHEAAVLYNAALQRISWAIDTMQPVTPVGKSDWRLWNAKGLGAPIVVFNPNSWEVTAPVVINHSHIVQVTDPEGKPLPLQRVRGEQTNGEDMYNAMFLTRVPALGYTVAWAYPEGESQGDLPSSLSVDETHLENGHLRLTFDPATGDVASLVSKDTGREFVGRGAAVPKVFDEHDLDTWAHNVFTFDREIGRFDRPVFTVLEQGPIRAVLRVATRYGDSELCQDFILYNDAEDVEVAVSLFWHERHKLLKLCFDTPARAGDLICEIPYAAIRRKAEGTEEPCQRWAAVEDGEMGLAVLNDSRYSVSCKEGELRLLALRGAAYADHYGYAHTEDVQTRYMEQGEREFRYVLRPYEGTYAHAGVVRRAAELCAPCVSVAESYHKGPLPLTYQGACVSCDHVILSALKPAEDGSGYILRAYECAGEPAHAVISLDFLQAEVQADLHPFEICTFRITEGKVTPCDLIEDPIL